MYQVTVDYAKANLDELLSSETLQQMIAESPNDIIINLLGNND
jgi:hypothetical protein